MTERGEVWEVRFDPSEGDEIRKIRPAVVMNVQSAGRMHLQIVVPITGWHSAFSNYFWMMSARMIWVKNEILRSSRPCRSRGYSYYLL